MEMKKLEILSYGQKAFAFYYKKWKLNNAWFKVYLLFGCFITS
jgi:hypothetical protein